MTIAKDATATVKNGFIVGGVSYYNIQNNGTATFENVTATAGNTASSMIDNWGTLTISSGDYSGGLNVVKSEEDSKLTIDGGKFTLDYAPSSGYTATILVYGDTTITGGEFIQNATPKWGYPQVVMTGVVEGYTAITKITGGTFTNKKSGDNIFHGLGKATSDNFEVSGGTFNKSISDGYCADGFIPTKNADGTYGVKEGKYVAAVGSKKCETLADAIRLAAKGKTVKLLNDVDLDVKQGSGLVPQMTVSGKKKITLDLAGHKIGYTTESQAMNVSGTPAMFAVMDDSELTVEGNGTIDTELGNNTSYGFNVNGGKVILNNGTYYGAMSVAQVQKGALEVKGGTYALATTIQTDAPQYAKFLINCIDAAYRDGTAKVSITGGTFVDFNPANCQAEGEGTNFLATGYITTKVGNNYVVKAGTNKNISDLDTAINTIKNATSSKNDKNAAVDVIKNIDNADLANNSAAMGKLAELDNTLTDTTSGSAKVTVTGESTVESIASNQVAVTNAALSADLTSTTTAQNVKITIADGSATIDDTAVAAAKEAAGITDNVDVQKLNISMEVNGRPVTEPTAPVVLEFPLPNGWKGCQIVCVDNATHPEVIPTTVIGNTVKATFNHFSDYAMLASQVITSPNKYQIELTPTNDKTTVYAGDTITFNVVLKQTDGVYTDKISQFNFKPESEMLTVTGTNLNEGFRYLANGEIAASNPATGISLDADTHTLNIGTITCKVKGFAAGNTALSVTPSEESGITLTGAQYTIGSPLTVAPLNVTYDVIKVTFTNYKAGTEGTSVKTYYTSANSKELYSSLNELADRQSSVTSVPEAVDGSITNGTQYRLADDSARGNLNNWVAADGTTKYVDLVAAGGTGFTESINFNVSRVQLLEVADLPSDVEIDETVKTTQRDSKTYVDHNEDFIFTVPDAGNGMKNEVTVKVGTAPVTPVQDATNKNKYTVNKSDMNDSPVKIEIAKVIDLDVNDIKVFGSDEGFRKYSAYSGSDTLVLIKGKTGVKYTLTNASGAPEIFELPNPDSGSDYGYGEGFNLAVLIPAPQAINGTPEQTMLDYLKVTYQIAVENGSNTKLNAYDFDTNGAPGRKIDDVQATYDFSAEGNIAWQPTDNLLLKADVLTYKTAERAYNTARDGQVTTDDVDAFLYNYVYTNADRPADSTNP